MIYYLVNNYSCLGSGKTITGELAILRMLRTRPKAKAIYVAPLKALARERLSDWQKKLGPTLGLSILELTGDVTPDIGLLERADILIVTPEKWDSISRGWQKREYVKRVELVIIDEIHLLGVDRGPVLVCGRTCNVPFSFHPICCLVGGNSQSHEIYFNAAINTNKIHWLIYCSSKSKRLGRLVGHW